MASGFLSEAEAASSDRRRWRVVWVMKMTARGDKR
jgi:hypothetical protein